MPIKTLIEKANVTLHTLSDYFNLISSYQPPAGTDVEQVVVREMPRPNDPVKNLIICMSDLHLDSQWSEGIKERLVGFMEQLKNMAKVKTY